MDDRHFKTWKCKSSNRKTKEMRVDRIRERLEKYNIRVRNKKKLIERDFSVRLKKHETKDLLSEAFAVIPGNFKSRYEKQKYVAAMNSVSKRYIDKEYVDFVCNEEQMFEYWADMTDYYIARGNEYHRSYVKNSLDKCTCESSDDDYYVFNLD